MRRLRLEWILATGLAVALVLLMVVPGPGGDGPTRTSPDPTAGATPCLAVATGPPLEAPAAADADVGEVAAVVEEIRELRFEQVPEPTYLRPERLAERVREELEYPPERATLDTRILRALEAIPEDMDLQDTVTDLYEGQVAGFYDTEAGELVVRAGLDDGPTVIELLILVHELQHALADQRLGIPDHEDLMEADPDAAAATLALIEGDAQVTTEAYAARALRLRDRLAAAAASTPGLGDAPHHLTRSLLFPYVDGARFVCALFREGGWEAVNTAYGNPPGSTAEILFPARYREGREPTAPRAPRPLPPPWRSEPPRTLGAADLLFLFEAPGGDPEVALSDPRERVRAWDGGELHVWTRGRQTALALLIVERPGGDDLCASVAAWYRRSATEAEDRTDRVPAAELAMDGPDRDAVLLCEQGEVRLGIGPDLHVARAVLR